MIAINLVPWREARREHQKKQFFILLGVTVLCAGVLIFLMHFVMRAGVTKKQYRSMYLQEVVDKTESELIMLEDAEREKQHLDARFKLMQYLLNNRYRLVRLLDELAEILPSDVYLNGFKKARGVVVVEGRAQSNNAITRLMKAIETSSWLTAPTLTEIKSAPDGAKQFTLTFGQQGDVVPIAASTTKGNAKKQGKV